MQHIVSNKSFMRLWRQLMFVPMLHNRWLTQSLKDGLTQAITTAEIGHGGEICLIIENHLPIHQAYRVGCRERALQLFAIHRVWDTMDNTGVLIYLNVCEHDLQIIADRGIDGCVDEQIWQSFIKQAISECQKGDFAGALEGLIVQIGELLRTHFPSGDEQGNEITNQVVFLR